MGCCGGGGVYRPPMPGTVQGVAGQTAQPGTIYRVTTPQGTIFDRTTRWEAEQLRAMRGGSLDIIEPGDQQEEQP